VIQIFPPPLVSGHIRIRQVDGQPFQIAGDIEISSVQLAAHGSAMMFPISDVAANRWTISFAVSSYGYFTGYAVAAANELLAVQTDVLVEVVTPDGLVAATNVISLGPRNRRAVTVPVGLQGGYLRFSANFPVHLLGSIGLRDRGLLDQLPALR
jgi:hypothetical protein